MKKTYTVNLHLIEDPSSEPYTGQTVIEPSDEEAVRYCEYLYEKMRGTMEGFWLELLCDGVLIKTFGENRGI